MASDLGLFGNISVSALSGAVGTLAVTPALDRYRLWKLSNGIRLRNFGPGTSEHYRIWVENHGTATIVDAIAYLDLEREPSDIVEGVSSFEGPGHTLPLVGGRLCWAFGGSGKNPAKIDIFPGERQLLNLAQSRSVPILTGTRHILIIASEAGFGENIDQPARTCLLPKHYAGTIRIVGKNVLARDFDIEIAVKEQKLVDPHEPRPKSFHRSIHFILAGHR